MQLQLVSVEKWEVALIVYFFTVWEGRALNDLMTKTEGLHVSLRKETVFYRIKVKSGVLDGYNL